MAQLTIFPFTFCPSLPHSLGDNIARPIWTNKNLCPERKYTVHEKEMAAIVHCLCTWRHYLLHFQTQKKLSPKQARWQDFLAEFDMRIEYKPGRTNLVYFSRRRVSKVKYSIYFQTWSTVNLPHPPQSTSIWTQPSSIWSSLLFPSILKNKRCKLKTLS